MATYSGPEDFMLGEIPWPEYMTKQKFLQDAADEMDSYIGFIYETPIPMAENAGVSRPVRLLLKRISARLSSGRAIMALDASGQNEELHNYGLFLLKDALATLEQIGAGKVLLDGAKPLPGQTDSPTGPLISNLDAESNVEAFYNRLANPHYTGAYPPVVL